MTKTTLKAALDRNEKSNGNISRAESFKIITAQAECIEKLRDALDREFMGAIEDKRFQDAEIIKQTLEATSPERVLLP